MKISSQSSTKRKRLKDSIVTDPNQLSRHPAVLAWTRANRKRPLPSRVEHIHGKLHKKPVFRLFDAETGNRSIIAKRCYSSTGEIEDTIYKRILPTLSFPAPRYYGLFAENEEYSWLFLGDVGENPFLYTNMDHQDAAARWLGRLHSQAALLSKSIRLESRGSDYYFDHLQAGRARILENMENPSLSEEDCSLLLEVVNLLEVIVSHWDKFSAACDNMPNTLVHGGIKPMNMLVCQEGNEMIVYFIDWERAGWGMPAPDLAPSRNEFGDGLINLEIYRQNVREQWPGLRLPDIKRMAAIGYFLRRLAAINWATSSLPSQYTERALMLLKIYLKDLTKSMRLRPWEN